MANKPTSSPRCPTCDAPPLDQEFLGVLREPTALGAWHTYFCSCCCDTYRIFVAAEAA